MIGYKASFTNTEVVTLKKINENYEKQYAVKIGVSALIRAMVDFSKANMIEFDKSMAKIALSRIDEKAKKKLEKLQKEIKTIKNASGKKQ